MRKVIIAILLFSSFFVNAQSSVNPTVNFRVGCGIAGETSPEVISIRGLVNSKSYVLLKKMLHEGNRMEAILSAIALKELQSKALLELITEEQQRIIEISNWQDEYTICYSCTQHFKGVISELMKNKNNLAYLFLRQIIIVEN